MSSWKYIAILTFCFYQSFIANFQAWWHKKMALHFSLFFPHWSSNKNCFNFKMWTKTHFHTFDVCLKFSRARDKGSNERMPCWRERIFCGSISRWGIWKGRQEMTSVSASFQISLPQPSKENARAGKIYFLLWRQRKKEKVPHGIFIPFLNLFFYYSSSSSKVLMHVKKETKF